jgi:hypothetical protein
MARTPDESMTPAELESLFIRLSRELQEVTDQLEEDEMTLNSDENTYEMHRARVLTGLARDGVRRNIAVMEAEVLIECREDYEALKASKLICESDRRKIAQLKYQIDIARSLAAAMRAAMVM